MRGRALGIWALASGVLGLLTVVVVSLLITFTDVADPHAVEHASSPRGHGRVGARTTEDDGPPDTPPRRERDAPEATESEQHESARTETPAEEPSVASRVIELAPGAPWPDPGAVSSEGDAATRGVHRIYRRLGEATSPTDGTGGGLPQPSLLVRAFAQESGDPLPAASVELTEVDGEFRREVAQIGAERELERLPATKVDVLLRHDTRVPRWERGLRLERGYEYLLDVELAVGRVLKGRVDLERRGAPLTDAEVRVWTEDDFWAEWPLGDRVETPLRATSDGYGRYEMHALPRSESFVIEVRRKGAATEHARLSTSAAPGTTERSFELERARPLRGSVLDEDGHPVEGAFVYAVMMAPSRRATKAWRDIGMPLTDESSLQLVLRDRAMGRGHWQNMFAGAPLRRRTDASGRFEFDDAPPGQGPALLGYDPDGGAAAVFADPGTDARLRLGGTALVSVSARDAAGAPVTDAEVWLSPTVPEEPLEELLGGRYGPRRIPLGPVLIVAMRDGLPTYQSWGRVTKESGSELDIRFARPQALTGVVLDSDRHPITSATVTCGGTEVSVGGGGRFRIVGPAEGDRRLRVSAPGYADSATSVKVPAHDVEVILEPVEHVPVRLVLPTGADAPLWLSAMVVQRPSSDADDVPRITHYVERTEWDGGQLLLDAHPDRRFVAYFRVPGHELRQVEFPPNASGFVRPLRDVVLRAAPLVEGRVDYGEHQPARGIDVVIREHPQSPLGAWYDHRDPVTTDDDGIYRFFLTVPPALRIAGTDVTVTVEHYRPAETYVVDSDTGPYVRPIRLEPYVRLHGRVTSVSGAGEEDAYVASDDDRTQTDAEGRFSLRVSALPARLYFGMTRSKNLTHVFVVPDEPGAAQNVRLVLSAENRAPVEGE